MMHSTVLSHHIWLAALLQVCYDCSCQSASSVSPMRPHEVHNIINLSCTGAVFTAALLVCHLQLSKMDRLGSMPPSPSRDAKYRMCIKIMGNTPMYITSEAAADIAKQLVSCATSVVQRSLSGVPMHAPGDSCDGCNECEQLCTSQSKA